MWFFDHFKIGLFIFLFWFVKYFIFYVEFFHRYMIWKYLSQSITYLTILLIMSFVLIFKTLFLQCCVVFCHTAMQIIHNDTYTPSPTSLPPLPPGHHRLSDWGPCDIQKLLTSYPSYPYTLSSVCMLMLLSPLFSLSPSPTVSTSLFSTSVSPFLPCKCWREYGEKGTLPHCWWECKLIQPLWRNVWRFLKKLGINLPYDPANPLLGIYSEKTIIQKDTCAPVFIAALFTIARTQKQPRCPLTDEWIRKMWYIHAMEY